MKCEHMFKGYWEDTGAHSGGPESRGTAQHAIASASGLRVSSATFHSGNIWAQMSTLLCPSQTYTRIFRRSANVTKAEYPIHGRGCSSVPRIDRDSRIKVAKHLRPCCESVRAGAGGAIEGAADVCAGGAEAVTSEPARTGSAMSRTGSGAGLGKGTGAASCAETPARASDSARAAFTATPASARASGPAASGASAGASSAGASSAGASASSAAPVSSAATPAGSKGAPAAARAPPSAGHPCSQ